MTLTRLDEDLLCIFTLGEIILTFAGIAAHTKISLLHDSGEMTVERRRLTLRDLSLVKIK